MDFQITNHGSIILVEPVSDSASDWLEENVGPDDDHQYWGKALVVEPRYLENLLHGMASDGLVYQ